jgi:ABC-type branched-subunit amino acid transport system ATPase component
MIERKSALKLVRCSVNMQGRSLLTRITIEVNAGQTIYILGANGAGKTILLDAICGYIPVSEGRILVDSLDITAQRPSWRMQRYFGRMFQEPRMPEGMTVGQFLDVANWGWSTTGLWPITGKERGVMMQKMGYVVQFLDLESLLGKMCRRLSVGERRLIAAAAAIGRQRDFLLLDEPYAGLSSLHASRLKTLVDEECRLGIGIMIVEHSTSARCLTEGRGFILEAGELVAEGEVQSLLSDCRRDNQKVRD